MMTSAPPVTPPDARLESASEATFVPAVDFQVTAPRTGYITEAESIAAGFTTGNLFTVLGARPLLGRTLLDSDSVPGAPGPFLLSVVGVVMIGVSGWLGGELVYKHHVGIAPRPEPRV